MAHAEDTQTPAKPAKHKLTAEQKAVLDELLAKYDTNKDGKLDKTEKSAMTADDKAKFSKLGLGGDKKKKKTEEAAPAAPATATAPATGTK